MIIFFTQARSGVKQADDTKIGVGLKLINLGLIQLIIHLFKIHTYFISL